MNEITILLTACGNVYMPGIVDCLKNNGERTIRLIGVDMNKDDSILQMFDAYYVVPKADDPSYIDYLLEICEKEKVNFLIPIMSAELEKLSLNKTKFEKIGTIVSVSNYDELTIANNKYKLFEYLEKRGMNVPKYCEVNTLDDIDKAIEKIGYPIVFKMVNGSGSRGMRIIDPNKSSFYILFNEKPNSMYTTLSEFKNTLSNGQMPKMMAMEYLPGDEYSVDLLAKNGKVKYSACRKGTNVQSGIIINGVVVNKPEIIDICNKAVEYLKLDGNIGFDIKERQDGTPIIMECNPRATAGISEFKASGLNLLYLSIKQLLNEDLPLVEIKYGTKMTRRYLEMYSE